MSLSLRAQMSNSRNQSGSLNSSFFRGNLVYPENAVSIILDGKAHDSLSRVCTRYRTTSGRFCAGEEAHDSEKRMFVWCGGILG